MDIFDIVEQRRPGTELGVEKKDGRLLHKFVVDNGIKKVVETGVCFGFSSSYFLDAVGSSGVVISIEPNLKPIKELVVPDGFYRRWIPVQNYSTHVLDSILKAYSPIDLFFHDSRHFPDTMMFEYTTAHKHSPRFIGSDDVDWPKTDRCWYHFMEEYGYREVLRGSRFAIAEKIRS